MRLIIFLVTLAIFCLLAAHAKHERHASRYEYSPADRVAANDAEAIDGETLDRMAMADLYMDDAEPVDAVKRPGK